jgi:hypothetical protein
MADSALVKLLELEIDPRCDEPNLVTKYWPTLVCRNCRKEWQEPCLNAEFAEDELPDAA